MLLCVFCGRALAAEHCVWVRLSDGGEFVACPTVCGPMRERIEALRRGRVPVGR